MYNPLRALVEVRFSFLQEGGCMTDFVDTKPKNYSATRNSVANLMLASTGFFFFFLGMFHVAPMRAYEQISFSPLRSLHKVTNNPIFTTDTRKINMSATPPTTFDEATKIAADPNLINPAHNEKIKM